MPVYSFSGQAEVRSSVDKVFQLFTDTDQLFKLLPENLHFRILKRGTRHLAQGGFLEFQTRCFLLPLRWKLHVHSFSQGRHIACMGRPGMIFAWEQDEYFEALPNNQTRVTHCLLYRLPLGFLGSWLDRFLIRPRLEKIFQHRCKALQEILQPTPGESKTLS